MLLTSLSAYFRRAFPVLLTMFVAAPLRASEVELKLPDLHQALFLNGISGPALLFFGLGVCMLGFVFGIAMYMHLRNLPVHESMLEISELIYETCKTYLMTQGKFLLVLEAFIGAIIVFYFGYLSALPWFEVAIILAFSLIGIAGSFGVAWFGIRVNTFAN
jgi:K(+)-stimulated pyrophosphate-energized sodium pump